MWTMSKRWAIALVVAGISGASAGFFILAKSMRALDDRIPWTDLFWYALGREIQFNSSPNVFADESNAIAQWYAVGAHVPYAWLLAACVAVASLGAFALWRKSGTESRRLVKRV